MRFMPTSNTSSFVRGLPTITKNHYARAAYALLKKQDLAFRHREKRFHLGRDETDADDRFLFLFLCRKLLEQKATSLAECIYSFRENGFRFIVSPYASSVGICATISGWNTNAPGEPDNAAEQFKKAWKKISYEDRLWMQSVFDHLAEDFPEYTNEAGTDVQTA